MRYASTEEILQAIREHPGLFMAEYAAMLYPDHIDSWDFGMIKQNVAAKIQRLRMTGRVRPIMQTTSARIHKWEAVE